MRHSCCGGFQATIKLTMNSSIIWLCTTRLLTIKTSSGRCFFGKFVLEQREGFGDSLSKVCYQIMFWGLRELSSICFQFVLNLFSICFHILTTKNYQNKPSRLLTHNEAMGFANDVSVLFYYYCA